MFQKRHLNLIAAAIAQLPQSCRRDAALTMAAKIGPTNPRFDRDRFLAACGV